MLVGYGSRVLFFVQLSVRGAVERNYDLNCGKLEAVTDAYGPRSKTGNERKQIYMYMYN